jgi:anti-anti-sigma regulatory factor
MLTAERDIPAIEKTFDQIIAQASRRVAEHDGDEIPIDCSAVTVIKSYMLDRLIRLHLDAQRCGVRVILENVNDFVFEVITLTRLDRMLRIRIDEGHTKPIGNHLSSRAR